MVEDPLNKGRGEMAIVTQRFISGTDVFDTYSGQRGSIVTASLKGDGSTPLSPFYVGAFFVVDLLNNTTQVFTADGRRIDALTGNILPGVTLITMKEYNALVAAGYPNT